MSIPDIEREINSSAEAPNPNVRDFDDVRAEVEFSGFSDEQRDVILGQLEQVWKTESGRDMLEAGLDNNGLHYLNMNDQSVIADVAPVIGRTADKVGEIGNFALPSEGEVYLNGYDGLNSDGTVQTYSGLHPNVDGQEALAVTPIRSLDVNGEVFSVPPIYTMIHETNHVARGEPDLPRSRAEGIVYDPSLVGTTSAEAAGAYAGANEISTREILSEMGITQQRGGYSASGGLDDVPIGSDYGLGRSHDASVTTTRGIDMTGHSAIDATVVGYSSEEIQAAVAAQGGSFTDAQSLNFVSNNYRLGDADDTVHAFDGNDTVHTGAGDDRIFLGGGDDVAIAGRGSNLLDGGDANLDPASDHRSDLSTDWGFDTVDYRTLPVGFASPNAMPLESNFNGVLITIDAADISVAKGQENAVQMDASIDTLHNIDGVIGTNRSDLTQVNELSADQTVDAAGGIDTLRFGATLTNTPGPVVFNGVTYDGMLTDGTHNLYHRGHENIVPEVNEAEAVNVLDQHMRRNGADVVPTSDASFEEETSLSIPMESAVNILNREGAEAVEQERSLGITDGPISRVMDTPAGLSVMETLVDQNERSLDVDASALNGSAYARVGAVLESAMTRIEFMNREAEVEGRTEEYLNSVEVGSEAFEPSNVTAEYEHETIHENSF